MKLVSIIILNWNGAKLLRKYLPSVVKNTNQKLADIIVADNGSTDESVEILEREFPEVRILRLNQNYGFARGYNLAIASIDTKYCVLLNDDVRVEEGWIEPMLEYMESNPKVGALQPKLLSDREPEMFEYAGAAGGFLDRYGYPFCRGRIFGTVEKDERQYDSTAKGVAEKIMWATGACLMVRTASFYKAGSLDECFFAHMEEIDLCWRMRNQGFDIVCLPEVKVWHYGGGSLAVGNPLKTKLNFRNSLLMLYKNVPAAERQRKIWTRYMLDIVAALNFALHFQFAHVAAIWKAHCEASRMYPHLKWRVGKAEREIFPEEKICILSEYYLHGKKTFKDLMGKKQETP